MQLQKIANFNGLSIGQRATAQIPSYAQTLGKVVLYMGGGLTKAMLSELVLKIGSRTFFGPISGTHLDLVMKYRGQFDHAGFVSLDLTEQKAQGAALIEVGGIDIPALKGQPIFIEVLNTLGAGTPTLDGVVGYVDRQFVDADKDGIATRQEQLMHKLLRYSLPNTGTRFVWQPIFGGAQIKRVHFVYTGTDWTTTANGNLYSVDVKLNAVSVHDRIPCLTNRFLQQENGKVPQSRVYTVDFCHDNNFYKALNTVNAKSLEFILELTATDNVTAYVECLDVPGNL
jgi:hypothetical protein